jgi:GAF domain-containing protein
MYFELAGGLWRCPVQTGSLKPAEVQAVVDQGLPYDTARILVRPWTSGEAYFQDTYGQGTEGIAPFMNRVGATATLPVRVDGRPIGILAVALSEQRQWSSTDRVVLETVARSLGQALERVQRLAQLTARNAELETERAALNAFARFTELVGNETNVQAVVRQAITVLHDTCEVDVVYAERDQILFKAAAWTAHVDSDLLNRLRQGFSLQHSDLALILKRNTAAFMDRWNDSPQWLEGAGVFGAVAGYPYFQQGEMESVLIMGSRTSKHWSERKRRIFRAVGRSLDLALERASQARQLTVQNTELVARTRALEAFADLSVEFTLGSDVYTLIRRAQEVALSLLPSGVALYYEPEGEHWRVKVQTGEMRTPALQATVNAGLLFNEAQSLVIPWTSGEPLYQSTYDPDTDHFGETGAGVGATATLPVTVAGRPVGILTLGFFQATEWSATDRVMLETIVRSLSLAMEGSRSLHQLAAQSLELENERAALAVLTAFTELVASETEVLILCAKAFEVMDAHFTSYSSVYYEQQGGLWKGVAWTSDLTPDQLGFIRSGLPLDFPTFAEALSSKRPVFIDGWDGMQEGVPDTDAFGPVCIYHSLREKTAK